MGAKIKPLHASPLLTSSGALDALLRSIDSEVVRTALMKWFDLALQADPPLLTGLSTAELALVMDKLPDLLLILYTTQSAIGKEETNEH